MRLAELVERGELTWWSLLAFLLLKALLVVCEALKEDLERRAEPDDLEMRDWGDMAALDRTWLLFSDVRLWSRCSDFFSFKLDLGEGGKVLTLATQHHQKILTLRYVTLRHTRHESLN